MAISDLVQYQAESSSTDSPATSEKPPSLARFEFIVKSISTNTMKGVATDNHHRAMMSIVDMIFDEAVQELVDKKVSDEMMSQWIFWFGKLFQWCATGDMTDLPEDMKEIVSQLETIELPA
jgi:hypothetical protein